jgi:hypothetical protein
VKRDECALAASTEAVTDDDESSPIPKIYTLTEAAEMLRVPREWLRQQLATGKYASLRRGSRWAMTGPQILDVIESMTVSAREPETYLGGLTRRSWLYHSNPNRRKPGRQKQS